MIETVVVKDVFETNAYFYIDEKTKHGFLIDPGAQADRLLEMIEKKQYTIEKIILTHGHFDHMGAVKEISERLQIPVYMHKDGKKYATDTLWNLSSLCKRDIRLHDIQYIDDQTILSLSINPKFQLQAIHIGGHTLDSTVYYSKYDHIAFVGDVMFKNSIGRSDFFGGNKEQLVKGIQEKILTLPKDTIVYSGHSMPTTIQDEKRQYISDDI